MCYLLLKKMFENLLENLLVIKLNLHLHSQNENGPFV